LRGVKTDINMKIERKHALTGKKMLFPGNEEFHNNVL
jgi:hypothetical protein